MSPSSLIALALAALSPPAAAQATAFVAAPEEMNANVIFEASIHTYGMSGGAAWFDLEGDLDEDLFVLSSDGEHVLRRREGAVFVDAIAGSGLETVGPPADFMGVIAADYDQNGLADLYLTAHGANALYTNLGGGAFQDDAPALGVAGRGFSSSAAFADFDLDGDLDLYVGNYIAGLSFPYHVGEENALYLNEGSSAAPQFADRAAELGVDGAGIFGPTPPGTTFQSPQGNPTAGCTLSVSTLDVDEDGDPDLLVGNDFGGWVLPDCYYQNDVTPGGGLAFTDVSAQTGFGDHGHYDMGINGADFDHDGDWDLYLSNLGDNLLFRNDGGQFVEVAAAAGPVEGSTDSGSLLLSSWGTVWADFDNDLWEDLFVVNGFIPAAGFIDNEQFAPNHLWMNAGDGTFWRYDPPSSGVADVGVGRGVAEADVDRDGWMDLFVVNSTAFSGDALGGFGLPLLPSTVYLNRLGEQHPDRHWLELWLHGWASNLEGLGARIRAEVGDQTLRRQVLADPVYLSSRSKVVHLGLGSQGFVDRLVVEWPSGLRQELLEQRGNRLLHLLEPRVTIAATPAPSVEGGDLVLPLVLTNHRDAAVEVRGTASVRLASSGEELAKAPAWTTLEPGETALKQLSIPLPVGALGVELELVARIECEGAVDMRAVVFDLGAGR